jgi:hypothetical protein
VTASADRTLAFLDLVAGSLQAPEGVGVSLARESARLDTARVVTLRNSSGALVSHCVQRSLAMTG